MWKAHEIDAKILTALLQDGRKSFVEIASECGVTKNKVWKRYQILEKRGIITGATTQINFTYFGYDALATLLINVEAHQIDQAMEYIEKIKEIRAHRQYNSVYNVRAVAVLKDLKELEHIKETIKRKMPAELKTYIWTGVKNNPENMHLLPNQKGSNKNTEPNKSTIFHRQKETRIDVLDMQIVEKLTLNGRIPFSEIAKKIGTSTDTIVKRYQKLKKSGALRVIIQINPNKLGYHTILDFSIAFALPNNSSGITATLAKIPDIVIITKTSGDYDLQLTAIVRDVEQMFTLQEEIAKTAGVTKIETSARKIPNKWPTPQQHITTF